MLLSWRQVSSSEYKGIFLPGAALYCVDQPSFTIWASILTSSHFSLRYYSFQCTETVVFRIAENRAEYRIELPLAGTSRLQHHSGQSLVFNRGTYQFTREKEYNIKVSAGTLSFFSIRLSNSILEKLGMQQLFDQTEPNDAPFVMTDLMRSVLRNPYSAALRPLYYEHCVRRMLFYHLTTSISHAYPRFPNRSIAPVTIPSPEPSMAIVDRDLIKIKKGIRQLFDYNVFEHLMYRNLDRARQALLSGNASMELIAKNAGYISVADFISGFRKMFGYTPRECRNHASEKPGPHSLQS